MRTAHTNMATARLPSLLALRAFEAAARRLSFTAAAQELHVSQAAISRHVRSLESQLDRPLFVRLHRRVALTPVGKELSAELTAAFASLRSAVLKASGNAKRALRLSVEPSFGALWLAARLDSFAAAHPHIELLLETSDSIRALGADADIAIRYVPAGSRVRAKSGERLFTIESFPVIGRAAGERSAPTSDAAVIGLRLLHDDDGRAWRAWFRAAGLAAADNPQQQFFTDYSLTVEAAERRQGVALGAMPFVEAALRSGRLVRIGRTGVPTGTYWLLQSRDRGTGEVRRRFCEWIRKELAASLRANRKC
jgi:LysR family transcriptional regulator, glycine cleavage system transcriptional activator